MNLVKLALLLLLICVGIIPPLTRLLTRGKYRIRGLVLFFFLCLSVLTVWTATVWIHDLTPKVRGEGGRGLVCIIFTLLAPLIVLWAFLGQNIIYRADELTRLRETYQRYRLSGRLEDLKNLEKLIIEVIDNKRYFSLAYNNELGEKLVKAQELYVDALERGKCGSIHLQNYYCLGYLLDIVTSSGDKQKVIQIYEKALKCPCQEDEDKKTYKKLCKNIQKRLRRLKRAR